MSLYPQTPQSIGKVLDGGFSLYRATFKRILPLSFLVALISQVPGFWPYVVNPASVAAEGLGGGVIAALVVAFLVWFAIYMAFYGGWLKSLDALARGGDALGFGAAFSAGLPKVLTMLVASILWIIALMVGTVLLVVPGLILFVSLLFFWFLIMLEDQGAIDALTGSHRLVWGNWWRTATVVTVAGVVYMVAIFLVMGIAGAVIGFSMMGGPTPEQTAGAPLTIMLSMVALQVVLNALLMPMMMSVLLVVFRDLQLRKSGADLAARAATA